MESMMKPSRFFLAITFIFLFVSSFAPIHGADSYSIVFIHIGKNIPSHVPVALSQARAFNPDCPIILIANQEALDHFFINDPQADITQITCESLVKTNEHNRFRNSSGLDSQWRDGFWLYTSERFLYLQDLMIQYDIKNVFHLEHDVMLYVNLGELLPIFTSQYRGMAVTMDNDQRCIPGFVYISNKMIMTRLASYFADHAGDNQNDMQILARFKIDLGNEAMDNLPIISQEYVNQQPMRSPYNHVSKDPQSYCRNIDLFQSIFDAAAIGQYLGGGDPYLGNYPPGFINESCLFNPSLLNYEWMTDANGRNVPFVVYDNKKFRINNLHIHSKNLWKFASNHYSKDIL